jgi:hypothetical protein
MPDNLCSCPPARVVDVSETQEEYMAVKLPQPVDFVFLA